MIKLDHATGLNAGRVVLSVENNAPLSRNLEKVGIYPSSINRFSNLGSMPSMPKTKTFLLVLLARAFVGANIKGDRRKLLLLKVSSLQS